jgi:TonB family protein
MALIKYGLSAPLFMLMLVLSSAAVIKNHTIRFFNHKAEEVLASPATSLTSNNSKTGLVPIAKLSQTEKDDTRSDKLESRSQNANGLRSDPIFVSVENEPRFAGGMMGFYQFLAANLQYPPEMMRYNIQGKVTIALTIEKDGSVSDVRSVTDVGYGSAEEAIRVLKKSPRWQPGIQNGVAVRVRYTLPISFDLVKEKNASDTVSKVSFSIKDESPLQAQNVSKGDYADTSRKFNMISGDQFDFKPNALYLLDGKAITNLNSIDPNTIKSIRIIKHLDKDNVYVLLYGERALNGVVLIELRDPNNKSAKTAAVR